MSKKNTKTTTSGLNWNEMLGLLSQLKRDDKYFECLLIGTGSFLGLRAKDLLNLTWNNVLNTNELIVTESKTGKIRQININPFLKPIFDDTIKYLSSKLMFNMNGYLFANKKGNKMSIQYVNRTLKRTLENYKVKCQNASTHTLRKTFGKRVWEMDGKSERSLVYLSQIFNHSNSQVTRRYIGIVQEDINNIYLSL